MRRGALAILLLGCGQETFDPEPIGSVVGYPSWRQAAPVVGPVPGHGDTVRYIFVNDVGASYPHGGRYKEGTILVKEVRAKREQDGQIVGGDLDYVAVMRKVDDEGPDPGVPIEGGWVFSFFTGEPGGDETYWDRCWATCHRQGPWDGAWFDYGL
jgi:hypothetical protein